MCIIFSMILYKILNTYLNEEWTLRKCTSWPVQPFSLEVIEQLVFSSDSSNGGINTYNMNIDIF